MKKLLSLITLLVCVIAFALPAQATTIKYELDYEFSGATSPAGNAPWLSAEFDDEGTAGSVKLTLKDMALTNNEHVKVWHFNFDPDAENGVLGSLVITQDSGPTASVAKGPNDFRANGAGYYDIEFKWNSSDRFVRNSIAVFNISGTDITAKSFDYLSSGCKSDKGEYVTAAHVGGNDASGEDESGWIAPAIPEPATMLLFGTGLVGFVASQRKKIKKINR